VTDAVPAVQVTGLTKRYGHSGTGFLAVDHIDFAVHRDEVFGFLGSNGAGKTTTIRLLTGLSDRAGNTGGVLRRVLCPRSPRVGPTGGVAAAPPATGAGLFGSTPAAAWRARLHFDRHVAQLFGCL
jgi:energy-coupling factor transporter ATP-binding protein EcfA2